MFPKGDVEVSLEIAIAKIDTLEQTYTADLSATLKYNDGDEHRRGSAAIEPWPDDQSQTWAPRVCTWDPHQGTDPDSFLRLNQALPKGERILRYSRSMAGMYLLNFSEFPFDEQRIEFSLWLDPEPRYVLRDVCVSDLETEFEIIKIQDKHVPNARFGFGANAVILDQFVVSIIVRRHPKFYLLNFFLVTYGLVLLQCTCIGINIDDLASRINLTLSLLLTLAAFKISVATQVPKSTEQTLLDKQVLLAFMFLGVGALQSLFISFEIMEDKVMEVLDMYFTAAFGLCWTVINIYLVKTKRKATGPLKAPDSTSHRRAAGALTQLNDNYKLESIGTSLGVSRSYWVRRPSQQINYATF